MEGIRMIKVEYIQHCGSELIVVNAARVSFGGESKEVTDKDKKLIKYLADHKHMSPFEHLTLTVRISVPLYIRSQIMRHRTFAYNEISRRYTNKDLEFYIPDVYRQQHQSNKQASYGALGDVENEALKVEVEDFYLKALKLYNDMLIMGVCREQSRGVLPQDLMTDFYMTGNLRNWSHFVDLRIHEGAQLEVQIVANSIKDILIDKFGYAAEVLLS
jgi:thymidylate synthase (FAD)